VTERTVSTASRLDLFVTQEARISRNQAQNWIRAGRVTLNGAVPTPGTRVRPGDRVRLEPPASAPSELVPEAIPLDIVYEDDHLLVVNKPAGLVVHPAAGHPSGTLVHALLHHRPDWSTASGIERPGIVHRLDKDTSGLLVVARTDAAHQALSQQLATRVMKRQYFAICAGVPSAASARIEAAIGRDPRHRQRMAVVPRGRAATTLFAVRERFAGAAALDVTLETGRTHQIRVHLAYIGHPVLGDPIYGRRAPELIARPALHAAQLRFTHPVTGLVLRFRAPLPADLKRLQATLRNQR
jgi:23S rRNA pseudouridine1911/1915/1917 synthase